MIHSNKIRDADVHFVIDPITRTIKSASATKTSVIQYDHNSERFTFMLPRYIEGHDMMESTKVEVHYINASAAASGVYVIEDLQTDETEENVVCSWLLSQNVTQNAGVIHFLLRFSCVAEDGTVEYVWNTAIYKGISVASGMNNADAVVEQYADVLEQWKRELEAGQIGVQQTLSALATEFENSKKLKLLKTITLEEDVAEVNVTFDKPLDEIAIMFNAAFLVEESKAIAARTNGGLWYMFWSTALALKNAKKYFYAHAKEVAERQWETFCSGLVESIQGISGSGSTPRFLVSRRRDTISRCVEDLVIGIQSNTSNNAFATGSTIEIWGHEADESL